jgi:putative chitinase
MPFVNEQTIGKALPKCEMALDWAKALDPAFEKYNINTVARISSFIAQTGYESSQYNRLEENLNYSTPQRLMEVWPKRFPDLASTAPYVKNPQRIGNHVYAGRLGNGTPTSGDGYRYRGRGIIQLTGRSNYHEASNELGVDLISEPDLLLIPKYAAMSAAWFWSSRGLNALADDKTDDDDLEDFTEITRRINGGTVGLQARLALLKIVESTLA